MVAKLIKTIIIINIHNLNLNLNKIPQGLNNNNKIPKINIFIIKK
jgi:hypothetical protein